MASTDISAKLYGGKHTVEFTESNHRYKVDGEYKKGVTTLLSETVAKPALALWPMNECLKSLGAVWDEKTSDWYITDKNLLLSEDIIRRAAKAYTVKRDKGSDVGSQVHAHMEKFLRAQKFNAPYTPLLNAETRKPWAAFMLWWESLENVEVLEVERVVYSETLDYAGTLDFILRIGDMVYLCDLKTSNGSRNAPEGIYAENFLQLGAYYFAYKEEREADKTLPKVHELMIVSCKKNGQLHTKSTSELGITPDQCAFTWTDLISLNRFKDYTERAILGKEQYAVHN